MEQRKKEGRGRKQMFRWETNLTTSIFTLNKKITEHSDNVRDCQVKEKDPTEWKILQRDKELENFKKWGKKTLQTPITRNIVVIILSDKVDFVMGVFKKIRRDIS